MNLRKPLSLAILAITTSAASVGAISNEFDVPGLIQAEDFSSAYDKTSKNEGGKYRPNQPVDIQSTSDSGGGFNVGWMTGGEWLEYNLDVANAGTYKAELRLATRNSGKSLSINIDGKDVTGTVGVQRTGGWQNFKTQSVDLGHLSKGKHKLRLNVKSGYFNLNWINVKSTSSSPSPSPTPSDSGGDRFTVPGKFEAEDYSAAKDTTRGNRGNAYRDGDVDIEATGDSSGKYNVGWIDGGEWLDYPIYVSQAGTYSLSARVASRNGGGAFDAQINGKRVGSMSIGRTGGWQKYQTNSFSVGHLSKGNHTLRVNVTKSGFNLNWLQLTRGSATSPTPSPTPAPSPSPSPSSSCNIDMTIWGYTLGDGRSRNSPSDIQKLVDNKNLGDGEITWNKGCPTFKVDNIASSSSGSSFSRSELRELVQMYYIDSYDDTDIENQWVTSKASSSNRNNAGGVNGRMNATLKVNTVSVDQGNGKNDQIGRIIVGQIHGVDHEPVKIYYQKLPEHSKGSVFFTVDGSDGKPKDRVYVIGYSDKDYSRHAQGKTTLSNPTNGIRLGDTWSYEIDLKGDQLKVTVWHNGKTYTTANSIAYTRKFREDNDQDEAKISNSGDKNAITIGSHYNNDWMYFKAGLYNQNNTGQKWPDYASVTFYKIDVQHD